MIKTITVEVPIYDMYDLCIYLHDRYSDYKELCDLYTGPDESFDDDDYDKWKECMMHYKELSSHIKSTYLDGSGYLLSKWLV